MYDNSRDIACYWENIASGKIEFRNKRIKVYVDIMDTDKADVNSYEKAKAVWITTNEQNMYFSEKGKGHFCVTKRDSNLSDMGSAYIMHVAQKIAITSVKTLVNSNPTEMMIKLYSDVCNAVKAQNISFDFDACENNTDEKGYSVVKTRKRKVAGKIITVIPTKVTKLIERGDIYKYDIDIDRIYHKNGCAYYDIMVDVKHEKNMYVPCADTELINKATKTELDIISNLNTDNGMDIVDTVYESILSLVKCGVINSFDDIWVNSRYYYKAVNHYIRSHKNHDSLDGDSKVAQDKDGRLIDYDRTADFDTVHDNMMVDSFITYLNKVVKPIRRDIFCKVAMCFACGMTQRETADKVGISQTTVSRYKNQIANHWTQFTAFETDTRKALYN